MGHSSLVIHPSNLHLDYVLNPRWLIAPGSRRYLFIPYKPKKLDPQTVYRPTRGNSIEITASLIEALQEVKEVEIHAGGYDGYNKFVWRLTKDDPEKRVHVYYRNSKIRSLKRKEKLLGGSDG